MLNFDGIRQNSVLLLTSVQCMMYDNIMILECTSMAEANDLESASSPALDRLGCSSLTVKK